MRSAQPAVLTLFAAATALALAACGSTVGGTPQPVPGTSGSVAPQSDHGPLADLLIDPGEFPDNYSAVVLPQDAVAQAAPDLTGIPAGATVDPAGCTPAEQNFGGASSALIVGTDNASRSTISIELTTTSEQLAARTAQLQQCKSVTATADGAVSTIESEIEPPPPVDADDSLAVKQTVKSGTGTDAVTRSMLTLSAQTGDLRVSATFMTFDGAEPDTATLDQLFTSAVEKAKTR